MASLSELGQPYLVSVPLAAGSSSTDFATTDLDLQTLGYDSVLFIGSHATVVGAGSNIALQVGASTAAFAAAYPVGSTVAVTAGTSVSNECFYIDAHKIQHRYVRCLVNSSTATVFGGIVAIPYDSRSRSVAASSDVGSTGFAAVVQPTTLIN